MFSVIILYIVIIILHIVVIIIIIVVIIIYIVAIIIIFNTCRNKIMTLKTVKDIGIISITDCQGLPTKDLTPLSADQRLTND